jgi:hypothetical protein
MDTFSFGFARHKWVKAVVYALVLCSMVLGLSLAPGVAEVAQAASCYKGSGYGSEWRDGEWHKYVLFLVGSNNNGHPNWKIYAPSSSGLWRFSVWGPPTYGGLKVGYRWAGNLPNPVPASYWMACKA